MEEVAKQGDGSSDDQSAGGEESAAGTSTNNETQSQADTGVGPSGDSQADTKENEANPCSGSSISNHTKEEDEQKVHASCQPPDTVQPENDPPSKTGDGSSDDRTAGEGSAAGTSTNNETQSQADTEANPCSGSSISNQTKEEDEQTGGISRQTSNAAEHGNELQSKPETHVQSEKSNKLDVKDTKQKVHASCQPPDTVQPENDPPSKTGDGSSDDRTAGEGSAAGTSTNNETQSRADTGHCKISDNATSAENGDERLNQDISSDKEPELKSEPEITKDEKKDQDISLHEELKQESESSLDLKSQQGIASEHPKEFQLQISAGRNDKLLSIGAVCVLLGAVIFGFYLNLSVSNPPVPKEVNVVNAFNQKMEKLQSSFPSQRPELWRRSLIHLRRHLKTEQPTEPVSLILTSGHGAEKTLGCLAQCLAQAFSSAQNSSFFNINGKSKASQDSDQVKMDIDSELKKAFKGQNLAAVIHRFEELPPGSTLIFYRYCDHENAAFKNVFLAFTIMLEAEAEVPSSVSLGRVEDMVYDHLKEKFVSFGKAAMFNQMDVDKLSGLWSRISHLILPVVAEEKIEQQGCWNCDK